MFRAVHILETTALIESSAIIGTLRVSIDFFFKGDARLGSGLLKYNIFR